MTITTQIRAGDYAEAAECYLDDIMASHDNYIKDNPRGFSSRNLDTLRTHFDFYFLDVSQRITPIINANDIDPDLVITIPVSNLHDVVKFARAHGIPCATAP